GYERKPPAVAEWNIKTDIKAAQTVFASGIPLVVAPLDATAHLKVDGRELRRLLDHRSVLTNQLHALYQLWDKPAPILFDPGAVALSFTERFSTMQDMRLEVDDKGITRVVEGRPNARVAMDTKRDEFVLWYVDRVVAAATPYQRNKRLANVAKPV